MNIVAATAPSGPITVRSRLGYATKWAGLQAHPQPGQLGIRPHLCALDDRRMRLDGRRQVRQRAAVDLDRVFKFGHVRFSQFLLAFIGCLSSRALGMLLDDDNPTSTSNAPSRMVTVNGSPSQTTAKVVETTGIRKRTRAAREASVCDRSCSHQRFASAPAPRPSRSRPAHACHGSVSRSAANPPAPPLSINASGSRRARPGPRRQ